MGLMEGSGLTSSDVLALTKNDEDGFMNGNGMWVFFLFFLLAWGNNGLWGNRGGAADSAAVQGALTRADLCESFNFNDLQRQTQGLANGLCDGFYAQNTTMMQGFHGVDNALCQGFNGVNASITGLGYAMKDCCCETNRNIDAVRYENAKNTCDITTNANFNTRDIIENQNMGIQRVLDFMTNDKIDSLRTELQAAQLQLSNNAQTTSIINAVRPFPQPSYITCSPYTANHAYGCAANCGCGCGGY